jgi:hypothetical protein
MLSGYIVIRIHPKLRTFYNAIELWMFCRKDNVKGFIIWEHVSKIWSFATRFLGTYEQLIKQEKNKNVLCNEGRCGRKYFVYQKTNYKTNYEWNITYNSCGKCAHNSVQNILPLQFPFKHLKIAKNISTIWSADDSGTWSHILKKQQSINLRPRRRIECTGTLRLRKERQPANKKNTKRSI